MKKLLPLTIALFAFCRLSAQSIPNGGFETWNATTWSDPTNYNTSNDQIFQGSTNPTANVIKVAGWNTSDTSVKGVQLTTVSFNGGVLPGYITNSVGSPFQGIGGIPYNQQPTGIEIWYNSNILPGDSGVFGVFFKQGGQLKAFYEYAITGTHTGYPILTETFTPALSFTPDTVIFAVISSVGYLEGRNTNFVGSTLTISGVTFQGGGITNPALLNGDFKSWTTDSILSLPGWQTNGLVTRTNDAYAGNYALELQTTNQGNNGNTEIVSGYATTSNNNHYFYPYTLQQDTFEFYYKYTSSVNAVDSGNVTLSFDTTGGSYLLGGQLPATNGYELVKIPIDLPKAPDSVFVNFFSFSSAFRQDSLKDVGSALEVDNVQFTSQKLANGIKPVLLANNTLLVYPNPAASQFTVASAESSINEIRLQNILGETVMDNLYSQGNATTRQMIDVSNLTPGLYFISITSGNKTSTGKIMVSR